MQSNKIESLLHSSASFLIFLTIGIFLWQMTFPYAQISASHGVMVVLIIMMMHGAFTNILKVPGYLNKGKISLHKIEKLLQHESEPENEEVPATESLLE